jgi:sec-independent protein translocase protein TatC
MLKGLQKARAEGDGMTLVDHLAELRRRIIIIIVALCAGFFVGFYYSKPIVEFFLRLPGQLVYLYPGEAFFVHLTVAAVVGVVLSFPVALYQVLRFILPGLRDREIRVLYLGLPFSMGLFVIGVVFSYQLILPLAYAFFMGFGTESLEPLISVGNYVSFVLGLVLPFGLVFQLPLVVLLLTGVGILSPNFLVRNRKYVILILFVVAAVLTPPDIISQSLMAIPMILLYEISIFLSRLVYRRRNS